MSINDFYIEEEKDSPQAGRPPVQTQPRDQSPSEVEKTFSGFFKNLTDDTVAFGKGLAYPFQEPGEFFDGMKGLVMDEEGDFDLGGLYDAGGAVVDRYKEIASDPGQSLYDQPLSTAMDIASLAFPVRGAAKLLPDGSTAQKLTEGAANVVQNMDPVSAVTTGLAAGNAAFTDPIKTTESVVKPSNAKTSKQRNPTYRERVMTGALDRGIEPTERGMASLQRQLDTQLTGIDDVIMTSNVTIPMKEITDGWESWAKSQISQTDANWADLRNAVETQGAKIKSQYANTPDGDTITGVSPEGLREMRISADGQVNHNKVNMVDDSVSTQVDKLYANYLREKLGEWIPDIKPLNAEASILFDIEDMYLPATNRISNNSPMGLTSSMGTMATGMLLNSNAEQLLPQAVGAAMIMAPPLINGVGPRISRSGSAHRSRRAGGADAGVPGPAAGLLGAAARDRNNVPFYLRQGGNALEGLFSEVSGEEERD
jgi:hypothetical protein